MNHKLPPKLNTKQHLQNITEEPIVNIDNQNIFVPVNDEVAEIKAEFEENVSTTSKLFSNVNSEEISNAFNEAGELMLAADARKFIEPDDMDANYNGADALAVLIPTLDL